MLINVLTSMLRTKVGGVAAQRTYSLHDC